MKKHLSFRSIAAGITLALCVVAAPSFTYGQVIINDDFDDGDIAINNGIGTGFLGGEAGPGDSTPTESGSSVFLESGVNGGRRSILSSNDFANTTTALGAAYQFNGVNFAVAADDSGDGTTRRQYFGVRDTIGSNDAQLNPGEGYFVEFGFGDLSGNAEGTSTFFYNSAGNVRTTLANWTFDTLSITDAGVTNAELDIAIDVSDTDWAISITGDTQGMGQAIDFSGTNLGSGIDNTIDTGYVFAFNQSESPNLQYSFDQVVVTQNVSAIPEPTSLALLGLGSIGLLVRRKRS